MELLLTKLRYATLDISIRRPAVASPGASGGGTGSRNPLLAAQEGLQIIGMSATMPNIDQV